MSRSFAEPVLASGLRLRGRACWSFGQRIGASTAVVALTGALISACKSRHEPDKPVPAATQNDMVSDVGFGFQVSDLPRDTGLVLASAAERTAPSTKLFEIEYHSPKSRPSGRLVVDGDGGVWRSTSAGFHDNSWHFLGNIVEPVLGEMRPLAGLSTSTELAEVTCHMDCADCSGASIYAYQAGARVLLAQSGRPCVRRKSWSGDKVNLWLLAVERQLATQ